MARSRSFVTATHLEVDGLRESMKSLKDMDKMLPRVVSKASRELTKSLMLTAARKNWASQKIRPSQAKGAITATATQAGAALKLNYGDERFPYAAGVEFGSKQFGQFKPWRGNRFTVAPGTSTGYVVQDAIRDNLEEFKKRWEVDVAAAIKKAIDSATV